jgi:hypothetical protein
MAIETTLKKTLSTVPVPSETSSLKELGISIQDLRSRHRNGRPGSGDSKTEASIVRRILCS